MHWTTEKILSFKHGIVHSSMNTNLEQSLDIHSHFNEPWKFRLPSCFTIKLMKKTSWHVVVWLSTKIVRLFLIRVIFKYLIRSLINLPTINSFLLILFLLFYHMLFSLLDSFEELLVYLLSNQALAMDIDRLDNLEHLRYLVVFCFQLLLLYLLDGHLLFLWLVLRWWRRTHIKLNVKTIVV